MIFSVFSGLLHGVEKWLSQWGYLGKKVALILMELRQKSQKNTTFLTTFYSVFSWKSDISAIFISFSWKSDISDILVKTQP